MPNKISYKNTLFTQSAHSYNYSLSHAYSIDGSTKEFTTNIEPAIMKLLLAYIEFYSEENYDQSWSMGYESIIEIINQHYAPVQDLTSWYEHEEPMKIDMYFNRERHCGTELYDNQYFNRDMKDLIKKLLDQEKLDNQLKVGEDAFNTLNPDYIE